MRYLRELLRANAALRFLLGAGVGLAVSIPLYVGVEDWPVRLGLMLAFGATFGVGSAMSTDTAERPRSAATWLLVVGVAALGVLVLGLFLAK